MGTSFKSKDFLLSNATIGSVKVDAHVHLYHEFLYFKSGDAAYVEGKDTYLLSPGDVMVTKPHVLHAISFTGDTEYSRIFIQLSPGMIAKIPHSLTRAITGKHSRDSFLIPADTAREFGLYDYFERGSILLADKTERNIYMAELLFSAFAVRVNEAMERGRKTESEPENELISSIKKYLDENCSKEFNLDELAKVFYMSKYTICHAFKSETGVTVSDYLSLRRIAAVRALSAGKRNLNEVYRQCGFRDYSTFYRTVKKYTGQTPSDFYGV